MKNWSKMGEFQTNVTRTMTHIRECAENLNQYVSELIIVVKAQEFFFIDSMTLKFAIGSVAVGSFMGKID